MVDNYTTNAGSGGDTFAADDIGGVKTPRVKMQWGPDGTVNDADVASGKPIPVQLRASSGTELALATAAKQPALGTAGTASVDVITIQGIASGTVVPVSDGGGSLTVDGSLTTVTTVTTVSAITGGSTAHDAAGAAINPILIGGYASAAAPTGVSADGDAVQAWHLRNGAAACVLTAAGALIGGDAANGLDIDVTRMSALVAGTALIGSVSASAETNTVYNGVTALTPKFAKISCSSSGVNIVVAAVSSKKIRVLQWNLTVSAAVNAKWQSHTTPTDLTGLYYGAAAGWGISASYCPQGYFESLSGESLDINLSGAVAVGGSLTYIEV